MRLPSASRVYIRCILCAVSYVPLSHSLSNSLGGIVGIVVCLSLLCVAYRRKPRNIFAIELVRSDNFISMFATSANSSHISPMQVPPNNFHVRINSTSTSALPAVAQSLLCRNTPTTTQNDGPRPSPPNLLSLRWPCDRAIRLLRADVQWRPAPAAPPGAAERAQRLRMVPGAVQQW